MKTIRRNHVPQDDTVKLFLKEIEERQNPGEDIRHQAMKSLKFFPPTTPELRRPAALRSLWVEFGSELGPVSWLGIQIRDMGVDQ